MIALKDLNIEEISTRPSYRVLAKGKHTENDGAASYDKYMELRQYPACKRTIEIEGARYFLQFPSMVFLWTAVKYRQYVRSNFQGASLAAFAAKKKIVNINDLVYQAPLPNVFDQGRVCMPTPKNPTGDNMVEAFWQSAFRDYNYSSDVPKEALSKSYGTLENWQKLALLHVEKRLTYRPASLQDLVSRNWMYPIEWFGDK